MKLTPEVPKEKTLSDMPEIKIFEEHLKKERDRVDKRRERKNIARINNKGE